MAYVRSADAVTTAPMMPDFAEIYRRADPHGYYTAALVVMMLAQMILLLWALIDLLRRDFHKPGNKWIWLFVVLMINIFGPILWFCIGRKQSYPAVSTARNAARDTLRSDTPQQGGVQ